MTGLGSNYLWTIMPRYALGTQATLPLKTMTSLKEKVLARLNKGKKVNKNTYMSRINIVDL